MFLSIHAGGLIGPLPSLLAWPIPVSSTPTPCVLPLLPISCRASTLDPQGVQFPPALCVYCCGLLVTAPSHTISLNVGGGMGWVLTRIVPLGRFLWRLHRITCTLRCPPAIFLGSSRLSLAAFYGRALFQDCCHVLLALVSCSPARLESCAVWVVSCPGCGPAFLLAWVFSSQWSPWYISVFSPVLPRVWVNWWPMSCCYRMWLPLGLWICPPLYGVSFLLWSALCNLHRLPCVPLQFSECFPLVVWQRPCLARAL